MKILVNGTPLLAPLTGIGQYIRHLFTAMEQQALADVFLHYGLRIENGVRLPSESQANSIHRLNSVLQRWVPYPRTMRRMAEKVLFAYQSKVHLRDAIYHEPNYVPMPFDGPLVLTVCDMSCFDHPQTHPVERVRLMEKEMPRALARADHVVVISESSKEALRRWFDVPLEKITTTYLAADDRFRPYEVEDLLPLLDGLGLVPGSYVLCVGTLEPRKNLSTLFAAYAGLPVDLRERFPLVVAGMSGWHTGELMQSAQALIQSGQLRLLGYVKDALIPPLYAGAAAFCYPSRYEGFGLPVLEAMASGVPVVTSNQTSLPEVVGQAGLMANPDDIDGMREALRRLLEDRVYAQNLVKLGLERAQLFSWNKCARETVAVYEKVLADRAHSK
jgi:glycosyltransferase involved in cell wall biosynthesis